MDGSDLTRTKGKVLNGKHVAGVDDDRSEIRRKRDRGYFFVAVPSGRKIGEHAEGATDLMGTLNRLHEQIISKDDYRVHAVVLSVVVENLGRFAPINVRCTRPASDSVKVRRRFRRPLGKVDGDAIRVESPMAIAVIMRCGWNGGDGLIKGCAVGLAIAGQRQDKGQQQDGPEHINPSEPSDTEESISLKAEV
jgi:hypothetical protein